MNLEMEALQLQVLEQELRERQLSDELEDCRYSLRRTKSSIAGLLNQMAPISKLSDDVLLLIFEAGVKEFDAGHVHEVGPVPFAILISHISARWRSIAIRKPLLWTTVNLTLSLGSSGLYDLYIERSRSSSLDINLYCDRTSPHFDARLLQPHRCRRLNLTFAWYKQVYQILPFFEDIAMPVLHSLVLEYVPEIYGHDHEGSWLPGSPVQVFKRGAPSLTHVKFDGISMFCCVTPTKVMTKLHLIATMFTTKTPLHCLSVCAQTLTDLSLEGDAVALLFETNNTHIARAGIQLPMLQSLTIRYSREGYVDKLAKQLIVPSLKRLAFGGMERNELCLTIDSLLSHRVATGGGIESLSLATIALDRTCLHHLAASCPDITNLSFTGGYTTSPFVLDFLLERDEQTRVAGVRPVWPRLRTLEITTPLSEAELLLQDLVQSRINIGHPLEATYASK